MTNSNVGKACTDTIRTQFNRVCLAKVPMLTSKGVNASKEYYSLGIRAHIQHCYFISADNKISDGLKYFWRLSHQGNKLPLLKVG